ncbi:MAG: hypothetical protein NTX12_04505 [Actinobacteria bacterium]|nr:hypothetical protein [Actinomycetota bacterium]
MSFDEEFSVEQSEELIAQLKTSAPSGFTQLHSTLNLLSHVSELSPVAMPPLLPSAVDLPVETISARRPRAHGPAITSLIVTAVLASASFAAAGVTGRGPAVIVEAAQKSGEIVANVVGSVGNTLTGNSGSSKTTTGTENRNSTVPVVPGTSESVNAPAVNQGSRIPPIPQVSQSTSSDSTSEDNNQSESDHPTVTADPSPSPLPTKIGGLGGLVLPPVTNPQMGEDSGDSENHATTSEGQKTSKTKKSTEHQSESQNQSQSDSENESHTESD